MANRKQNEILEEFIEIYKSEPCLWRVKCRDYHDRKQKSAAYGKLVAKLKELEPTATKDDVLKKINSFRTSVRREKRKCAKSVRSEEIYKPKLWYFHLFDFLGDQDVPRSSRSNISESDENDSNDAYNSTDDSIDNKNTIKILLKNTTDNDDAANTETGTSENIITPRKARVPAIRRGIRDTPDQDPLINNVMLPARDNLKRPAPISAAEDRYDLFGRYIAMKLRSVEKRQRLIAEKIINDTLFDAEMGNLNIESVTYT